MSTTVHAIGTTIGLVSDVDDDEVKGVILPDPGDNTAPDDGMVYVRWGASRRRWEYVEDLRTVDA